MTSVEKNKVIFKDWLRDKSYAHRSINDIVSRVNYVEKVLGPLSLEKDPGYLKVDLDRIPEFHTKSSSVKSHIRKSMYLYFEFLKSK